MKLDFLRTPTANTPAAAEPKKNVGTQLAEGPLPAEVPAAAVRPTTDSVTVSAQGRRESSSSPVMSADDVREQIRQSNEQAKAEAKKYDEMGKCFTIASRIMSGDNVPPRDMKFLAEKNSELYMRAISLRMKKADPKDYDQLTEDEEEESTQAAGGAGDGAAPTPEGGAGGEAPPAEAPPVEALPV